MRVTSVRAHTLRIPLQTPVLVGTGWEIDARDYLLVAVATDAGISGIGWSYARGADLVAEVKRLTPHLQGADPARTQHLWNLLARAMPAGSQTSAPARALSALDVALWDLKAQAAGLPLHRLLGGHRAEVPVQMAGMYYSRGRRPDDDAREAAALVENGFRTLKMMGGVAPFGDDLERVRAVRTAIGPSIKLGLDVHHAWHDARQATAHAKALGDYDVAFIEEPIPPERAGELPALNAASPIPIAMGELAFGRRAYQDLVAGRIGILRPDATAGGGITEWIQAHALATAQGVRILPHYFPYVHIHVAAGLEGVEAVECVTTVGDISNFHRIVRHRLEPRGGVLRAPDAPGLGIDLDWNAVEQYTVPARGP
jgi:L-alanine-DL-glutamate epimerase-like enolase superfamily enzyme